MSVFAGTFSASSFQKITLLVETWLVFGTSMNSSLLFWTLNIVWSSLPELLNGVSLPVTTPMSLLEIFSHVQEKIYYEEYFLLAVSFEVS